MSEFVAILDDPIEGTIAGEHHDHSQNPHQPGLTITGKINGNVSSKVTINGKGVATVGSTTEETDPCCLGDNGGGEISTGYSKVRINGKPIAMVGSKVTAHNGTAEVSGSHQNRVKVG